MYAFSGTHRLAAWRKLLAQDLVPFAVLAARLCAAPAITHRSCAKAEQG
jgi:hypothetical protein